MDKGEVPSPEQNTLVELDSADDLAKLINTTLKSIYSYAAFQNLSELLNPELNQSEEGISESVAKAGLAARATGKKIEVLRSALLEICQTKKVTLDSSGNIYLNYPKQDPAETETSDVVTFKSDGQPKFQPALDPQAIELANAQRETERESIMSDPVRKLAYISANTIENTMPQKFTSVVGFAEIYSNPKFSNRRDGVLPKIKSYLSSANQDYSLVSQAMSLASQGRELPTIDIPDRREGSKMPLRVDIDLNRLPALPASPTT